MPFYAPAVLCCNSFFPYMIIQFLRGIPRELDESAYIDGCGTFKTLTRIILPLMKPALFSAGLFQFLWTYNDYFNSLIFINSVKKYPISLALRMSLDAESVVQWGKSPCNGNCSSHSCHDSILCGAEIFCRRYCDKWIERLIY